MVDLLANALNAIKVAERKGQRTCEVPNSKLINAVLSALKENKWIENIEKNDRTIKVTLNGMVNDCGAVKPRFFVKNADWEKYETRLLPSKSVGMIIVSTPTGILTHVQAKAKKVGGTLLAFVY